jgi:hypothetical protein
MNCKTPSRFQKMLNNQEADPPLGSNLLRSIPLQEAIQMAQKTVKKYFPAGKSLVDDLIQARREEAASE